MAAQKPRAPITVLSVALVAANFLVSCTGLKGEVPEETKAARSVTVTSPQGPPEGALLLFSGEVNGALLLVHGAERPIAAAGLVGYEISPDGAKIVATSEERLSTGISYNPELALIDTRTGGQTVLARAGPKEEFNGPIKWSPDGTRVAYNFVEYGTNPARVNPGPRPELQTICVLRVLNGTPRCFWELRRVFDFDWAPDGQSLVVTGPGPLPMQVLDPTTGHVSSLVTLENPALRRELMRASLGGKPVQFTSPAWSPSGMYIAAWVNAPLPVPAIFTREGQLVALGRPGGGNGYKLSWWPGRDVLLYAPGFSVERRVRWTLRALDPSTGRDRVLLSEGRRPFTNDFALSPSGRWLALLRWRGYADSTIQFLDLVGNEPPQHISWPSEGSFADWGTTTVS